MIFFGATSQWSSALSKFPYLNDILWSHITVAKFSFVECLQDIIDGHHVRKHRLGAIQQGIALATRPETEATALFAM